jgi:hypothetical protein
MNLLNKHKGKLRLLSLVLQVIAIAGPWGYDLINVPSEYACNLPFIRLYGDFCGLPISGGYLLFAVVSGFFSLAIELFSDATGVNTAFRLFFSLMVAITFILPFVRTIILIGQKSVKNKIFNYSVWGLAAILCLIWGLVLPKDWILSPLWGYWLYSGLALSMLCFEILFTKKDSTQSEIIKTGDLSLG